MNDWNPLLENVTLHIRAVVRCDGERRTLAETELRWQRSGEAIPTDWHLGSAAEADMQCWLRRPSADRAEATVEATAREGRTLEAVIFAIHVPARAEDEISWPFGAGAMLPVRDFPEGRTLELTYPVYASMQWVDVFGAERGIYIGAHDAKPYFKHLLVRVERAGRRRMAVVELHYTDLEWPADKAWQSPPLVLARHEGDWRAGARIYRTWADSWFRRDAVPEWLRRACGHNMVSFRADRGRVPFRDLPRLAEATSRLGIPAIHIADWMEEGFDTFYPAYNPDPTLGGSDGLRRAIARAATAGVGTCLYLNGRLLDPAGPHGAHAFDWAVKLPPRVKQRFFEMWERTQDKSRPGWDPAGAVPREPAPFNRDGTAAEEWWGRVMVPMCPTVSGWRELWLARMSDVLGRMRPALFQVDQVCGCWGMPCYDESHPHRSPALAWSGYKDFCRAMRRRAQALRPDIGFWTEGVNDLLGQPFDGLQAHLTFDSLLAGIGRPDPRLFKFTFPEYLLVTGDLDGTDPWALWWGLVTGGHYHFALSDPDGLDPAVRRQVRFAARMRSRYWRHFTSHQVFVPDTDAASPLCAMGYRAGLGIAIAGAAVRERQTPDEPYRASLHLPEAGLQVRGTNWLDFGSARIKGERVMVEGRGPFVLLLERRGGD